jgi:hypothetical protein
MMEVARQFTEEPRGAKSMALSIDTADERRPFRETSSSGIVTRWVTFHQGYSYEDFILGLRPESSTGAGFTLKPKPGVLLELAAEARSGSSLLLIDEINRGNASRIFGEFITLMETEKRLGDDGKPTASTVIVTLPYLAPGETVNVKVRDGVENLEREFAMPSRIFMLASMNSVDKSIAPIDTAIRRRFHVINLSPTPADLKAAVGLEGLDNLKLAAIGAELDREDIGRLAVEVLRKLNRAISLYLGPDFVLGQWYLKNFSGLDAGASMVALCDVWLYRLLPQLIELFHGRGEALAAILGQEGLENSGIVFIEPTAEEVELGGASFIAVADTVPAVPKVISYLQRLAGAPIESSSSADMS